MSALKNRGHTVKIVSQICRGYSRMRRRVSMGIKKERSDFAYITVSVVAGLTVFFSVYVIANTSLLAKGSKEENEKLNQIRTHSKEVTEGGTDGITTSLGYNKDTNTRTWFGYFSGANREE